MDTKRKITKASYDKVQTKISSVEEKIVEMEKRLVEIKQETRERTDSAITACKEEIASLRNYLNICRGQLQDIEIIEVNEEESLDVVELGDAIDAKIIYGKDDEETISFVLSDFRTDNKDEITINSPLGQAIYHKPVGTVVRYSIPNTTFVNEAEILQITKPNKLQR